MVASYENFRPTSRLTVTKDGSSAERTLLLYAADEGAAYASTDSPHYGDSISVGGFTLYCNHVQAQEIPSGVNSAGALLFEITATYATLDKAPVAGKARWSVAGQNDQAKRFAVDDPAQQDHYFDLTLGGYEGQGIGITEDGAEGCDVDDPYEVLRIDLWKAPADVGAYLDIVRALRRKTNQADFTGPWGTYEVGEARLVGYNVQHVNGELDEISLEFLCRKAETFDVTVKGPGTGSSGGGTVVEVVKPGHSYYWQRTQKQITAGDDTKAKIDILDAHVATVYYPGDFSGLGISFGMFDMPEPGS